MTSDPSTESSRGEHVVVTPEPTKPPNRPLISGARQPLNGPVKHRHGLGPSGAKFTTVDQTRAQ
ncbi:MAG TPA: hypothetical protein PKB15_05735 [Acidimicrobiia bacterium]|nr:hypothetical protein [Acidimicrobiia bacterium]